MPGSDRMKCIVLARGCCLAQRTPEGFYGFPDIPLGRDNPYEVFSDWSNNILGFPVPAKVIFDAEGICGAGALNSLPDPKPGLCWIDLHRYGDLTPDARSALAMLYATLPTGHGIPEALVIWQIYVCSGGVRDQALRHWTQTQARANTDLNTPRPIRWKILGASLLLALLFDIFFIQQETGLSCFTYTLLFIICSGILNKGQGFRKPLVWISAAAALLLSLSWALHNDPILLSINSLAVPMLLAAMLSAIAWDGIWSLPSLAVSALSRGVRDPVLSFYRLFPTLGMLLRKDGSKAKRGDRSILWGFLIAVPLFFLVAALLTSSDEMFAGLLRRMFSWLHHFDLGKTIWHIFLTFCFFLYFFGLLWSQRDKSGIAPWVYHTGHPCQIPPLTGVIILCPIVLLYALFIWVQFTYLFSGGGNLPGTMTYAGYAHRGFAQLVAVSIINMAVITALIQLGGSARNARTRALRALMFLVLGATLVMLASASYRMAQYIGAYGYTWLRVTVMAFIAMLAFMQLSLAIRICSARVPLYRMLAAIALIFYIALNFISIDSFVAKGNIDRYFASGTSTALDDGYIGDQLGCDAAREVLRLNGSSDPAVRQAVTDYMERNIGSFQGVSGLEWNLGRARFYQAYRQWKEKS